MTTNDTPAQTPDVPSESSEGLNSDGAQSQTSGELEPAQRSGLEALLFLADVPLAVEELAEIIEADPETVDAALTALSQQFTDEQRGMEVHFVAGGWRMYSASLAKPYIERWALAGRTGRLTQAALETLAVIAYKQPIGRHQIGDIRGVNADGAVRSLVARGLVTEVGKDDGPGQAALFGTTDLLLERLGLQSLEQLPELTDFLPEAPAPDEPELNAFKEIRKRLAAGDEMPVGGLGGRSAAETNTGTGDEEDDDDVLPSPLRAVGERHGDEHMDQLTDQLENAARNAVGRLRAAVEAADKREPDDPDGVEDTDDVDGEDKIPPTHRSPRVKENEHG